MRTAAPSTAVFQRGRRRTLVQGADVPQPHDGFLAAHGNRALGGFPMDHRRHAHVGQLAEFGLGQTQALPQGTHALARDPKTGILLRAFRGGRGGGEPALAQGLRFLLQSRDLAPQVGDEPAMGRVDPLDRGQGLLDFLAGQTGNFRLQFFHHVGHVGTSFASAADRGMRLVPA